MVIQKEKDFGVDSTEYLRCVQLPMQPKPSARPEASKGH